MTPLTDFSGSRFNSFVVLKQLGSKNGKRVWSCRCDCGKEFVIKTSVLKRQVSCGCKTRSEFVDRSTKHGMFGSPTYISWQSMIARCENKNADSYRFYGEKGISVCSKWRESFSGFLEDMGVRPSGKTLDRIDHAGNYEPGNCRWATTKEQSINKKTTVQILYRGQNKTLKEWCLDLGLGFETTHSRINLYGHSVEEAFEKPVRKRNAIHVFAGSESTLQEIANKTGLNYRSLAQLINTNGMSPDDAVARLLRKKS